MQEFNLIYHYPYEFGDHHGTEVSSVPLTDPWALFVLLTSSYVDYTVSTAKTTFVTCTSTQPSTIKPWFWCMHGYTTRVIIITVIIIMIKLMQSHAIMQTSLYKNEH